MVGDPFFNPGGVIIASSYEYGLKGKKTFEELRTYKVGTKEVMRFQNG